MAFTYLILFFLGSFLEPSQSQLTLSQQNELISLHNQARSNAVPIPELPLPNLSWNTTLANYAQNWSSQCLYDYSDYFWFRLFGENIALEPLGTININQVFNNWLSSQNDYDFSSTSCTNQGFLCDPYLQIVWQRTTQFGCGLSTCPQGDFLVCSYDPPGAWPGVPPYNSSQVTKQSNNNWKLGVLPSELKGHQKQIEIPENETIIDWRLYGVVTKVKFQGTCGSCWTFAAVATMESQFYMETDGAVQLFSEEQLLDCSREYPNYGCNGGHSDVAFKYVINIAKGAARASSYPYTGLQTLCDYKSSMKAAQFKRTQDITNSHDEFITTLRDIGPFPVFISTDSSWQNYAGGILRCPTTLAVNHAVTLVGWNNDTQTYIIKNSWGPGWGEAGFANVDRNQNCGILRFPTSVILMD